MIISAVLIPIVILMTAMKSDLAVLFFPVLLLFVIGLTRLLYAYLLQERMQQKKSGATIAENTTARMRSAQPAALPAQQSVPIDVWRKPASTAEMIQPPSVTDNTTKLFDPPDRD